MTRQVRPPPEITLLTRLHDLEPASTDRLLSRTKLRDPNLNALHAVMAARLAGTSVAEANELLERCRAQGLATHDGHDWGLTDRGRALGYEAGELDAQRLSRLWGVIADILPGRPSFARVLDVGGAGGTAGAAMREAGFLARSGTYVAVDISHRALTSGIELSRLSGDEDPATLRVQGTAYRLPLARGAVDCCVSRSTLYYLQKRTVLSEMTRVLSRGGYLIVAVPTMGYMTRRAWRGWSGGRLREAIKYTAATILGSIAWLGVDVRPPRALFTGESRRGLRAQLARVPGLRLVFLKQLSLPFIGSPLLLVAEKLIE